MKYFRIGTLNFQNNLANRRSENDNALILANHIIEKEYDILGTQELTRGIIKKVDKYLKEYNFYGGYQYGRSIFGMNLPLIKDYNQSNKIITKKKAVKVKTRGLPSFPINYEDFKRALKKKSLSRRIVTKIEIEEGNTIFYIINTHLDYCLSKLQKRQLKYLIRKVSKYSNRGFVVLMGDFNMQATNNMFKVFENELNMLGLRRVPVNEKTNSREAPTKTAIDHIFIPKAWKIVACGIFEDDEIDTITDHKAVYVDVII